MSKRFFKMLAGIFLFLAIVGVHMFMVYNEGSETQHVESAGTLPVVSVMFQNSKINTMCGYTMDMEPKYMREHITPITEDNKLKGALDNYPELLDDSMDLEFRNAYLLAHDTDEFFRILLERLNRFEQAKQRKNQ